MRDWEQHGRVWLKRDDRYEYAGVHGGKVRTCHGLAVQAKRAGAHTLVTAGSRHSPQVNIVAHVARELDMSAVCFVPSGPRTLEMHSAERAGAILKREYPGYNSVITKRARDYAFQDGHTLIPFGMECREAVMANRFELSRVGIPDRVKRLVVAVGSGMTLAGLVYGLKDLGRTDLPVLGIRVGADPTKRLQKWAPIIDTHVLRVQIMEAGEYSKPAHDCYWGTVRLDSHYEAKCIPYLQPGDALWVVGIRETERGVS